MSLPPVARGAGAGASAFSAAMSSAILARPFAATSGPPPHARRAASGASCFPSSAISVPSTSFRSLLSLIAFIWTSSADISLSVLLRSAQPGPNLLRCVFSPFRIPRIAGMQSPASAIRVVCAVDFFGTSAVLSTAFATAHLGTQSFFTFANLLRLALYWDL